VRGSRTFLAATTLLAIGGCALDPQTRGLVGIELARLIADTFASAFQVFVQATA
jgi:hypothetical protein